ncbi:ankyrin repeat domain-containing protein [bacterium]|nr:ankyrin repeat domain-containing protein [bacterium]
MWKHAYLQFRRWLQSVATQLKTPAQRKFDWLAESIVKGNLEFLRLYLSKGGDPNLGSMDENPLISVAVYYHNVEAVEELLGCGAVPACHDESGWGKWNALANSAFNGYADIVSILLQHGVPVDTNWMSSTTALHEACMMRCGADCPAWDYDDEVGSPAEIARYVETARILVQAGADVNAVCEDWPGPDVEYTPLHFAVEAECLELVAFLIANDADKGATSSEGRTALDLARERNASNIIEFLEALDANM